MADLKKPEENAGERTPLRCVRTCIGCFKKSPQNELIRIVRLPNKEVVLDRSTLPSSDDKGPRPAGRSVYLCHDPICFTKAAKSHKNKNVFQGRLHTPVNAETLENLRAQIFDKK